MLHFNKKLLSLAVSAVFSSYCTSTHASDLEIYSNAKEGLVTLFMMLDTSGSMGYGDGYDSNYDADLDRETRDSSSQRNYVSSLVQDYNVCRWDSEPVYNKRYKIIGYKVKMEDPFLSEKKEYTLNNNKTPYNVNYCSVDKKLFRKLNSVYQQRIINECEVDVSNKDKYKCYDRLTRLKIALIQVLTSSTVGDTVRIGLGQFSSPKTTQKFSHDSESGRVVYPAVEMTPENRQKLVEQVLALNAFNATPSAAAYAESGMYMLGKSPVDYNSWTQRYTVMSKSGFLYSNQESKKDWITYQEPLTEQQRNDQCNGTGIYFLTDGYANSSNTYATQQLMSRALAPTNLFSAYGLSNDNAESGVEAGWPEIGAFANLLRTQKNIKTAVVGFGSLFPNDYVEIYPDPKKEGKVSTYYDCSKLPIGDVRNTCNWGAKSHPKLSGTGGFGEGGFYSAQSVSDVMQSVGKFINDVKPVFEPMNTGSPTVPVDTFEPTKFDNSAYYSTLTPTPGNTYQLWVGNLNKYQIINGVLAGENNEKLHNSDGTLNSAANGYWSGGVQGLLPLKEGATSNSGRKILTNRSITANNQPDISYELNAVTVPSILDTSGLYNKDPSKGYWLNLLGFKIDPSQASYTSTDLVNAEENRQLGSILHSTPILLNQKSSSNNLNREDYLLFGTTQGLLHVVSANSNNGGKEIFTFVPSEMFEKQKTGFLNKYLTTGELFYGIDAPWVSYSQRKMTSDNTLSVNADNSTTKINGPELLSKSLQWVYGGLRMGGKSYYALDLTKIRSPELKFHIDPENQKVISSSKGVTYSYPELSYMGQSWSKPTIAWVNFEGKKRLVMFVGGGYDMGYENKTYKQDNGIGAGVYMFDANSGQLLWYVKNSFNRSVATNKVKSTYNEDMKYSVVSSIDAIDRDGDGLVDNLYFGDLGGQVFRVDINNLKESNTFVDQNHIVRLTTQHKDDGLSPRFYDSPTITIHSTDGNIFAAVSIASGNRSNPLAEGNQSAQDGLYVIYDNDIVQNNLFADGKTPAHDATLLPMNINQGVPRKTSDGHNNGGWVYTFPGNAGHLKAINGLYSFGSLLRVNLFDKDGTGISKNCGAGVKGDTGLMNFCLPTGKCPNGIESGKFIKVSAGIAGTSASMQVVNGKTYITTTGGNQGNPKKGGGGGDNGIGTSQGLQQLRWYEQ